MHYDYFSLKSNFYSFSFVTVHELDFIRSIQLTCTFSRACYNSEKEIINQLIGCFCELAICLQFNFLNLERTDDLLQKHWHHIKNVPSKQLSFHVYCHFFFVMFSVKYIYIYSKLAP